MATTARYKAQLIVLAPVETAGEINAYSVKANTPKSELLRDALLSRGWAKLKRELSDEYGTLTLEERHYGILTALPAAEREEYLAEHGLSWDNPLCQVSADSRGRPLQRTATGTAEGAE
jgi:hypothetical protein